MGSDGLGYGSKMLVWVGDDDDGDEDSGFGVWVMKVLGLEVGVGEVWR